LCHRGRRQARRPGPSPTPSPAASGPLSFPGAPGRPVVYNDTVSLCESHSLSSPRRSGGQG